jgi:hypothetical protein
MALAGREEHAIRLSVRDHHACSVYEKSRVQNGVLVSNRRDSILVMLVAFPP